MFDKRINIILGHYGSGKTNIALNFAYLLRERYEKVAIADLDIVNPYFRTKDSEKEFEKAIKATKKSIDNLKSKNIASLFIAIFDSNPMMNRWIAVNNFLIVISASRT